MPPTSVNLRSDNRESSPSRPQRAMDAYKVTMTAELDSGWIDKEFLGVFSLGVPVRHAGITAQVYGRYKLNGTPDAATETLITDKDGAAKVLDLDQNNDGSNFVVDEAAPYDQVKVVTSGNITGDLLFGFGG